MKYKNSIGCKYLIYTLAILTVSGTAIAEPPPGAVVMANPKKDVLKTSASMLVNKKKIKMSCGHVGSSWVAGVNKKTYFYPLSANIQDKKNEMSELQAIQEAGQGTDETAKLMKKTSALVKTLKSYVKKGKIVCKATLKALKAKKSGSSGSSGGAAATPTPTSGSGSGSSGNTYFSGDCLTAYGRSALGIPSSISSACKSAGQSYSSSYSCVTCHSEKSGRNYSQSMASFSLPTMSALPHSSQSVANLVAYLNRSKK